METYTRQNEQTAVTDDPAARTLLRQAFEKTARWQPDFRGFSADLTVNVDGKETKGSVTVKGPRDVSVELPDADLQKWAQEQLGMIAVHRGPRNFEESDGKYTLTLGEDMLIHWGRNWYSTGTVCNRPTGSRTIGSPRSIAKWPPRCPCLYDQRRRKHGDPGSQVPHDEVHRVLLFSARRQTHQRGKLHRHARPRRIVRPSRDQTDYFI